MNQEFPIRSFHMMNQEKILKIMTLNFRESQQVLLKLKHEDTDFSIIFVDTKIYGERERI